MSTQVSLSKKYDDDLYLIDGSGFIFRAFYALPPLTAQDGTPVGAVYGMCQMLLKLLQDNTYKNIAVVFDTSRITFRTTLYPEYKANRLEPPEDLIPQFSLIRKAVQAFGLPVVELEGFEADDLIASYTKASLKQKKNVTILSSDKDLVQMLQEGVSLKDPMKNIPIDSEYVMKKWGISPHQMIDFQSMVGDASDNIPGIKGVGPKTASGLLETYHTLDGIYDHVQDLKPAVKQKFLQDQDQCFLSKKLVTLDQDVPLPVHMDDLVWKFSAQDAYDFAQTFEFNRLAERLKIWVHPSEKTSIQPYTLSFMMDMDDLYHTCAKLGKVVLVQNAVQDNVYVGVDKKAYILDHYGLHGANHAKFMNKILEDPSIQIIGFETKSIISSWGIQRACNIDDVALAFFVLQAGQDLSTIANISAYYHIELFSIATKNLSPEEQQQKILWTLSFLSTCFPYILKSLLQHQGYHLYMTIERPLIPVLSLMEQWGMHIDKQALQNLDTSLTKDINGLENRIYGALGKDKKVFNLSSASQLGEVLFDELKIQGDNKKLISKTKGGKWSTDSSVLEKFVLSHPLVKEILSYRQLTKLRSTYTSALLNSLDAQNLIHTNYVMTGAQTGRLSSKNPNVQNIPIRYELGRKIRQFVTTRAKDYILIGGDYNQIELRILAVISKSSVLQEAFRQGEDIHSMTAKTIFGQVNAENRRKAKMVNFGLIYGMSAYGLAERLQMDVGAAKTYIDKYFHHFSDISDYMKNQVLLCEKFGYVRTLFGRKIYIPTINSKNYQIKEHAKRQAINAPIQGTAADIIKKAMLRVHDEFEQFTGKNQAMILQIHDELLLDIPKQFMDEGLQKLRIIMTEVVHNFHIPFTVKLGMGTSWDNVHNGDY